MMEIPQGIRPCWLVGAWPRFRGDLAEQIPVLLALSETVYGAWTEVSPEVVWEGARTNFPHPWDVWEVRLVSLFVPAHRLLRTLPCSSHPDTLPLRSPNQGLWSFCAARATICAITRDLTYLLLVSVSSHCHQWSKFAIFHFIFLSLHRHARALNVSSGHPPRIELNNWSTAINTLYK